MRHGGGSCSSGARGRDSRNHGPRPVSLKASHVLTLTVSISLFLSVLSKPCIPGSASCYLSLKKRNCRNSFCTRPVPMFATVFSAEFALWRAGILCWAWRRGQQPLSPSLCLRAARPPACSLHGLLRPSDALSPALASSSARVWRACPLSSVAGLAHHELPPLPSGPGNPPCSPPRAQVGPSRSASFPLSRELELGV